ncbi:response regulator [Chitinophaga rhizophila]|uniref:Response regulator n=1 Tax=Chitinophaga rhizophila TaxID=2866212 RepID=A0ABS7G6P3_9BACT|nr:response regulator [Chitinophaga rhizophila]MBW8683333.1 response regulator [Chitinophaga rhizophila]
MQKIIVLDDDDSILEAVSLVLKRRSMEVLALKDAAHIEQHLQSEKPGLLLMDIFLGRYDGRGVCRKLKNNPLFKQLPIVLFTAQTYTPESVEESGADAILNKPFSINALASIIEKLIMKTSNIHTR